MDEEILRFLRGERGPGDIDSKELPLELEDASPVDSIEKMLYQLTEKSGDEPVQFQEFRTVTPIPYPTGEFVLHEHAKVQVHSLSLEIHSPEPVNLYIDGTEEHNLFFTLPGTKDKTITIDLHDDIVVGSKIYVESPTLGKDLCTITEARIEVISYVPGFNRKPTTRYEIDLKTSFDNGAQDYTEEEEEEYYYREYENVSQELGDPPPYSEVVGNSAPPIFNIPPPAYHDVVPQPEPAVKLDWGMHYGKEFNNADSTYNCTSAVKQGGFFKVDMNAFSPPKPKENEGGGFNLGGFFNTIPPKPAGPPKLAPPAPPQPHPSIHNNWPCPPPNPYTTGLQRYARGEEEEEYDDEWNEEEEYDEEDDPEADYYDRDQDGEFERLQNWSEALVSTQRKDGFATLTFDVDKQRSGGNTSTGSTGGFSFAQAAQQGSFNVATENPFTKKETQSTGNSSSSIFQPTSSKLPFETKTPAAQGLLDRTNTAIFQPTQSSETTDKTKTSVDSVKVVQNPFLFQPFNSTPEADTSTTKSFGFPTTTTLSTAPGSTLSTTQADTVLAQSFNFTQAKDFPSFNSTVVATPWSTTATEQSPTITKVPDFNSPTSQATRTTPEPVTPPFVFKSYEVPLGTDAKREQAVWDSVYTYPSSTDFSEARRTEGGDTPTSDVKAPQSLKVMNSFNVSLQNMQALVSIEPLHTESDESSSTDEEDGSSNRHSYQHMSIPPVTSLRWFTPPVSSASSWGIDDKENVTNNYTTKATTTSNNTWSFPKNIPQVRGSAIPGLCSSHLAKNALSVKVPKFSHVSTGLDRMLQNMDKPKGASTVIPTNNATSFGASDKPRDQQSKTMFTSSSSSGSSVSGAIEKQNFAFLNTFTTKTMFDSEGLKENNKTTEVPTYTWGKQVKDEKLLQKVLNTL